MIALIKKTKVFTMILASTLFLAGTNVVSSYNVASNVAYAAGETEVKNNQHEYDELYGLRVEVKNNPTASTYDTTSPDFSGLELSVFSIEKNGNESETLSSATLEAVREKYDVNIIEVPGGGAFVITVSAYSTALQKKVSGQAEFQIEKNDDSELMSIKAEITSLPLNLTKTSDSDLDLTGLAISIWEINSKGTEETTFTNADLKEIESRYSVEVRYKSNDNSSEGTCTIRIYTYVREREVSTVCEFNYTIDDKNTSIKGDINADGVFNVSDVVLLQKWLLAVPDTHLADWKAGNFIEDDRLDVFDLCLMKRELIYGSPKKEYPVKNPEVIDEYTPYDVNSGEVIPYAGKFFIIIKCQYSNPDRTWTAEDFKDVDNIKSVTQSCQDSPYRTVLEITLQDSSTQKLLTMIQEIEDLEMEEIKEFKFYDFATGLPE